MGGENYVKLKNLTASDDEPIEDILQRGADQFPGLSAKGTVEFRLIGSPGPRGRSVHTIQLTPAGARPMTQAAGPATLTVLTTPETFRAMASGSYSPSQAYLDGNVHIIGNADLAKQMVAQLADSGTQVAVCPNLINESYRLDGPGIGTITLSGEFFTPGGTVDVVYDFGGGQFRRIITADPGGKFTVSERGLFCGDIPGRPGVGVIVTATDLATGKSTTQNYATPC